MAKPEYGLDKQYQPAADAQCATSLTLDLGCSTRLTGICNPGLLTGFRLLRLHVGSEVLVYTDWGLGSYCRTATRWVLVLAKQHTFITRS